MDYKISIQEFKKKYEELKEYLQQIVLDNPERFNLMMEYEFHIEIKDSDWWKKPIYKYAQLYSNDRNIGGRRFRNFYLLSDKKWYVHPAYGKPNEFIELNDEVAYKLLDEMNAYYNKINYTDGTYEIVPVSKEDYIPITCIPNMPETWGFEKKPILDY